MTTLRKLPMIAPSATAKNGRMSGTRKDCTVKWRRRVGIEPTYRRFRADTTVLKTAEATRPHSPPCSGDFVNNIHAVLIALAHEGSRFELLLLQSHQCPTFYRSSRFSSAPSSVLS